MGLRLVALGALAGHHFTSGEVGRVKKEVWVRKIKVNPKLKENKVVFSESGFSLAEITPKNAKKVTQLLKHVHEEALRKNKRLESRRVKTSR